MRERINIGSVKNLVILHHKRLFYLFYHITLQNNQLQWFYFSIQHNKIIYLLQLTTTPIDNTIK